MSIKIGAAYIRVSSDEQTEYSPDSQLKLIRDYAKREGYVIPDEYVYQDDGISGKSAAKRPAFRMMIAQAKESAPPFDSIFVWKYSRFARNQEEAIMYKNLLKKRGIAVRSISEPSSDSPFSSLIERIIEWMDEYYLINLSGEVKRGMTEKAQRGEAMGRPPFGYCVKNKKYVPDENAEIVRYVFSQFAAGRTRRDIAVELGEKGIRTQNGKAPEIYWVSYLLKNPTYIGKIRWTTEDHDVYRSPRYTLDESALVDGLHEPIIDRALWDAVQAKLNEASSEVKYVRKTDSVIPMLKGLVRCENCGAVLSPRRNGTAFQCFKYTRGICHASHYISARKANAAVIEGLELAIREDRYTLAPKTPPKTRVVHDWDKLIASEESRLNRAKNALLDGVFTTAEYAEIKATTEDNITRLKQGQAAEAAELSPQTDLTALRSKVVNVLSVLKSPDVTDEAKNRALRSIVEKIIYNKPAGTFEIYFTF